MSRLAACVAVAIAAAAPWCAHGGTLDVVVRDPSGQPVADAAIYALPAGGGVAEARGRTAEIAQVEREFVPFMTVVQAGTSIAFPNRDPILHHVYSFSPAKPFEIKLYTGKSPHEVVFDKPGVVVLGCNIHDWMLAYVVVVPTPYFGHSDSRGAVHLRDVPGGAYELHAYHPFQRGAVPPQAVSLAAGAVQEVAFQLELQPRKSKFKPPLDRLKY